MGVLWLETGLKMQTGKIKSKNMKTKKEIEKTLGERVHSLTVLKQTSEEYERMHNAPTSCHNPYLKRIELVETQIDVLKWILKD